VTKELSRRPVLAVIGDAAVEPGAPAYDIAREIGRLAIDAGLRVMTGGLGGVMEAACRGAHESTRYREGKTIGVLPSGDLRAANRWVDIALPTALDHARNAVVAGADAIVAVGGGAGTLSEMSFAWIRNRLIVALTGVAGWSEELAGRCVDGRPRFSNMPEDRVFAAASAHEALAIVAERLPLYRARY